MSGLTMRKKLYKTGPSLAIVLPKAWTDSQRLSAGDTVEVSIEAGMLKIAAATKTPLIEAS
jgi:antitoxin component of MazEF toxin-antitoxin module